MARVLYTGRAGGISTAIAAAGHDITCQRVITHQQIAGALEQISASLADIDWVTITSVTTADYLAPLAGQLVQTKIASGGPATSRAARAIGLTITCEAAQPGGSRPLAKALATQPASRVLIITSALSDDWLTEELNNRGHQVRRVNLYDTVPDDQALAAVARLWPTLEVVVVSSPSSARALNSVVDLHQPAVIALGERTSSTLTELGIPHRTSSGTTGADLCQAIEGVTP